MICGHLERGGEHGTEICTREAPHPGQRHLLESFATWSREVTRWHRERGEPVPSWLAQLAQDVLEYGARELADALDADRILRQSLASEPGDGQVPGSRSTRPGWHEADREGAEWASPGSDRSATPPEGYVGGRTTEQTSGHLITNLNNPQRGILAVANAEEMIAAIDGAIEEINQAQQVFRSAIEKADTATQITLSLGGTAIHVSAVHTAAARLNEGGQHGETAIQSLGGAIEILEAWKGLISAVLE